MPTTVTNYINHIALVLDGSGSMRGQEAAVIKVADEQIKYLAQRSKELDQETRVTVYTFENKDVINCLIYDKDVLRVPSIKGLYKAVGQTPLIDATLKSIDDLEKTATLYGDHSFLIYVITDGAENASRAKAATLTARLNALPENWTLAAFVPNAVGLSEAKRFGFPANNIQVWDTTSSKGFEEVGATIRATTDSYLIGRTKGIRGYRNLFTPDVQNLSKSKVAYVAAGGGLDALHFGQYRLLQATKDQRIDEFIERNLGRPYRLGEGFYELLVPVKIQPQKEVVLLEKGSSKLYKGPAARKLLGLPNYEVRVSPDQHRDFSIFIQSTSVNRKVLDGQKVIVLS